MQCHSKAELTVNTSNKHPQTKTLKYTANSLSSTAGMEVTCKTLENQRKFKLKLQEGARVLDLVEKLKCELGESNDYRCVCLGKLMRDCDSLSHYTISEILPIIVMITDRQEILRQQQQIR